MSTATFTKIMIAVLIVIVLAVSYASAATAAMADESYSQTTDVSCQMTTPLMPVSQPGAGLLWSRGSVLGGDSSTGPTFLVGCLLPT
jgi:hypothetical protein